MRNILLIVIFGLSSCAPTYQWVSQHDKLPKFAADRNECAAFAEKNDPAYDNSFMNSDVFHECMNGKGHVYTAQGIGSPSETYTQDVINNITLMNAAGF